MAKTNIRNQNGHARRNLRATIYSEENNCGICGHPVDKTLGKLPGRHTRNCHNNNCQGCAWHPMSPTIDEIIPVTLGGNPIDRSNTRLAHRRCNRQRSNKDHKPPPAPTTSTWAW